MKCTIVLILIYKLSAAEYEHADFMSGEEAISEHYKEVDECIKIDLGLIVRGFEIEEYKSIFVVRHDDGSVWQYTWMRLDRHRMIGRKNQRYYIHRITRRKLMG